ncbi:uncharacterized protein LOC113493988 [Trichoplusia ni]|uniref:Uncharacterized protein LOC113493988 n=1 Tax=Trichoplusia ni TaxID=7111 RepID=A0A7E5VHY7_TRINI|nr:uncharacterized protein LOC113493988 [Trichoplusia ni]
MISHGLEHVQIIIELCQLNKSFSPLLSFNSVSMLLWIVKSVMIQIILSVTYEQFYAAVENVKDACSVHLMSNCSGEEKRLCKNVKRLCRSSFDKINAWGLFYVDSRLPLSLVGLLTNYTVVLLQFAFL